jgi:hypothetical protein
MSGRPRSSNTTSGASYATRFSAYSGRRQGYRVAGFFEAAHDLGDGELIVDDRLDADAGGS